MQILITTSVFKQPRVIQFTPWSVLLAVVLLIVPVMMVTAMAYHSLLMQATRINLPVVSDAARFLQKNERDRRERYMRENLDAMAVKVGELQARLDRGAGSYDDLADALLYLMERYTDEAPVNVGWGEDLTIRENLEFVARLYKLRPTARHVDDAIARLRAKAGPPGRWVRAIGYDERIAGRPDRRLLDAWIEHLQGVGRDDVTGAHTAQQRDGAG